MPSNHYATNTLLNAGPSLPRCLSTQHTHYLASVTNWCEYVQADDLCQCTI